MIQTVTGFFLLVVFLYFIEHVIYVIGVYRATLEPESSNPIDQLSEMPMCTVLVCARDEEKNIEKCLASLDALNYPKDKLQGPNRR